MSSSQSTSALVEDVTGQSLSECLPADDVCKQKEDEAAAKAALEKKQAEDAKYKKSDYQPVVVAGGVDGLECSMDGFKKFSKQLLENAVILIALLKETFAFIMPDELNLTVSLYWDGLMGLNNWVGFLLAAIYYVGTDYGFGLVFCEIMGYGYYVIDGLNYIVQFAAPEDAPAEEEPAATEEQKQAAAAEAAKNAGVSGDSSEPAAAEPAATEPAAAEPAASEPAASEPAAATA